MKKWYINTKKVNMIRTKINSKTYDFFTERTAIILAIGGLVSILIGIIVYFIFGSWKFSTVLDEAKIAQFGDLIGGVVGSILSLAGIILYYVALKEQRKDMVESQEVLNGQVEALKLQVEEFRAQKLEMQETRKVYLDQTKEFKRQTEIAKNQQFDSSFYSILNVFINLRKELNSNCKGNSYFSQIYNQLKSIDITETSVISFYPTINSKYIELYYENYSELTYYFNTFYRIIRLIENSTIEQYEKELYFEIFRSQLTNRELLLLYYNYHSQIDTKDKHLVIKYKLFKDLSILDRIEFAFPGNNYQKLIISGFLNSIIILIVSNLEKYNDIESNSDVFISEIISLFNIQPSVSLKINEQFIITITIDKDELSCQDLISKDFMKKYIILSIYDALYFSKFKIPTKDIVEFEYVERDQNNCFDYRFIIKEFESI